MGADIPQGRIAVAKPYDAPPVIWPHNLPWDHPPVGNEFFISLCTERFLSGPHLDERYRGLDNAVARFAQMMLPQVWNGMASVQDERGVIVLMYQFTPLARDLIGPYGRWVGVKAGFDALAEHWDPLEVAIWETMAREGLATKQW